MVKKKKNMFPSVEKFSVYTSGKKKWKKIEGVKIEKFMGKKKENRKT